MNENNYDEFDNIDNDFIEELKAYNSDSYENIDEREDDISIDLDIKDIEETPQEDTDNDSYMQDFFTKTIQDVDKFDDKAWQSGTGYTMPHYSFMTEKFEGITKGLYIWAGKPNHGKSAIAMNTLYDLCTCPENKLLGIYFSLDDDKDEIIPRLVSMMERIPISVVSKPQRYQEMADNENIDDSEKYAEMLQKREDGINKLKNNSSHIIIVDSSEVSNVDDIYNYIKTVKLYLKVVAPDYNIAVVIDSIYDVRPVNPRADADEAFKDIARTVKQWTVEFDCPIFATAHMKKVNGHRRPQLDDVKDSVVLQYEASVIFLVYNDVSENKQGAEIFRTGADGSKEPILEIDWAKNKKSSYKDRSFCYFAPNYSRTSECTEADQIRYSNDMIGKL